MTEVVDTIIVEFRARSVDKVADAERSRAVRPKSDKGPDNG